ncbi:MAG: hypothetical protein BV459_07715 [Thermoplasmata archaeon M11B2D]|nr:MAG: hypothetical protein BV459_07715 [Thermoplasmata archaeon M11B2D]PNX53672.1 MAG: hypothetical protein BV458_03185 [Thermoplasmata archaeon M9B2D]
MKYEILGICTCILLVAPAVAAVTNLNDGTRMLPFSNSSDIRQAFIFGRYTNVTAQGEYLVIEAVRLWVIYKEPRSFDRFPPGTLVTFKMYTAYGQMFKNIEFLFLHVELVVVS